MDNLVRLPTQHGDMFVRPSAVMAVHPHDGGSQVYAHFTDFTRIITVTIDAETVVARLQGEEQEPQ